DRVYNRVLSSSVLSVAALLPASHALLLSSLLVDDVREFFCLTTEHSNRIPRCACVPPLLGLLIEAPVRLSSTKREARFTILTELQTANLTNICSKTYLRQLLVLLNLCCTIPANTDPWFFLLILR